MNDHGGVAWLQGRSASEVTVGPRLTARDYREKDTKGQEDLFGLRNAESIDHKLICLGQPPLGKPVRISCR